MKGEQLKAQTRPANCSPQVDSYSYFGKIDEPADINTCFMNAYNLGLDDLESVECDSQPDDDFLRLGRRAKPKSSAKRALLGVFIARPLSVQNVNEDIPAEPSDFVQFDDL